MHCYGDNIILLHKEDVTSCCYEQSDTSSDEEYDSSSDEEYDSSSDEQSDGNSDDLSSNMQCNWWRSADSSSDGYSSDNGTSNNESNISTDLYDGPCVMQSLLFGAGSFVPLNMNASKTSVAYVSNTMNSCNHRCSYRTTI